MSPASASVRLARLLLAAAAVLVVGPQMVLGQARGSLRTDSSLLIGTHPDGEILLYAPSPIQLGSSISHWDPSASPNLLMEPAISADLPFLGLDITPALMTDIGWQQGTSTIVVTDLDPVGVGFTDPTPFAGAPGNPATTLGEARVNLVNGVLSAWASTLSSSVDIDVIVTWTSLPCSTSGAVLAGATTTFVFRDSGGQLPEPDVWYPAALAEAIVGTDLTGNPADNGGDIMIMFNSSIDEGCLMPGSGFYYGLDGNAPPYQIDLSAVILHELAHGLGMANFHNEYYGVFYQGYPSIYDLFTFDKEAGLAWDEMTDGQRVVSAANDRQVVWSGAATNQAAQATLDPGQPILTISEPAEIAGIYQIGTAVFGPPLDDTGVTGEIVCAFGSHPFTGSELCDPVTNVEEVAGRIALVDRGNCYFTEKVSHAQAAGAIGVIVINSEDGLMTMGGYDSSLTIPAVIVRSSDGELIRAVACANQQQPGLTVPTASPTGAMVLIVLLGLMAILVLRRATRAT